MISQKCPRCNSKRVRRGYRHTPILSRLIGRYHLLCDNCNWEFVGFAVPGTTSSKPTRKRKSSGSSKGNSYSPPEEAETKDPGEAEAEEKTTEKEHHKGKSSHAAMLLL